MLRDNEITREWIKSLEEEEFPQCTGALKVPETGQYCATGVLMKKIAKDKMSGMIERLYTFESKVEHESRESLVGIHTGLTYPEIKAIESLNDMFRLRFRDIAKILKRNIGKEDPSFTVGQLTSDGD